MRIRHWEKFQHYKHRKPPWIRLYRELLEDPDWMNQSDEAKALLCELWMVASDTEDGSLPAINSLAWRLRRSEESIKSALVLINEKFIEDASGMLADCKQGATTEYREEKSRDRVETEIQRARNVTVTPEDIDRIRDEHAEEEKRLTRNLLAIRDSGQDVQAVLDLVAEKGRKPYSAYGWLRNGRSGVPETRAGVTVLRLLNAALEARQRAQETPVLSDNNRKAFDAIDRVADRLVARRDSKVLKEIEG